MVIAGQIHSYEWKLVRIGHRLSNHWTNLFKFQSWHITLNKALFRGQSLLLLSCQSWCIILDMSHLTYSSWLCTLDLSILTYHTWNISLDLSLWTYPSWHGHVNPYKLKCYSLFAHPDSLLTFNSLLVTIDFPIMSCHSWKLII